MLAPPLQRSSGAIQRRGRRTGRRGEEDVYLSFIIKVTTAVPVNSSVRESHLRGATKEVVRLPDETSPTTSKGSKKGSKRLKFSSISPINNTIFPTFCLYI